MKANTNFNCLVSFQGYDWINTFTVVSPTGHAVRLQCNGRWDKMSPELLALVNKYQHGDAAIYSWGNTYPQPISRALMLEIKSFSASF